MSTFSVKADDVKWMTEVIYFEARDQELVGQIAVGCVVKNRVESKRFPNTVKGVVHQYKQFSYYWDGKPERYYDDTAYFYAKMMANHVLTTDACDYFGNINHYINHSIANPKIKWYTKMKSVMTVGDHSFYED